VSLSRDNPWLDFEGQPEYERSEEPGDALCSGGASRAATDLVTRCIRGACVMSCNYTLPMGLARHEPGRARDFAIGLQHGMINGLGGAVSCQYIGPKPKPRHSPNIIT
jgi:hypothetical protein